VDAAGINPAGLFTTLTFTTNIISELINRDYLKIIKAISR